MVTDMEYKAIQMCVAIRIDDREIDLWTLNVRSLLSLSFFFFTFLINRFYFSEQILSRQYREFSYTISPHHTHTHTHTEYPL